MGSTPPPVVAIAGRPNAGKSTLFNRLLGRRRAIVAETPGVTRDENRADLLREGRRYALVDTGGIEEKALEAGLAERVQERSLRALAAADVVIHLVDGKAGLSAADRAVTARIRTLGVPVVLAVNKVDREEHEPRVTDFHALGADDPIAVSAAHGRGIDELWERIEAALEEAGRLPAREEAGENEADFGDDDAGLHAAALRGADGRDERAPDARSGDRPGPGAAPGADGAEVAADSPPRIALIGRPNVGKSSLLNRLVGFERSLVDAVPGTTRDSIDAEIERGSRRYVVVDTAGLRRPSRIVETIEGYAAAASLRAIERAEVAVLVLDAKVGVTDQDLRLADLVWRRGRGLVVAVNKADLAPDLAAEQCHDVIARRLPQWPPLPLARVSALAGTGLKTLFAAIDTVVAGYRRRIPTPKLNTALRAAVEAHPPALVRGRAPKLLYAAQVRHGPQEIAIVASRADGLTLEYQRYLTHRLREAAELVGVPLALRIRERARSPRERAPAPEKRPRRKPLARGATGR